MDPTDKVNDRPISITSIISKVFERILVEDINLLKALSQCTRLSDHIFPDVFKI